MSTSKPNETRVCPDCGADDRDIYNSAGIGFACPHAGCVMSAERAAVLADPTLSDTVKKAMRRFWRRLDEVDAERRA